MRVVRWSGPNAVILVRTQTEVTVAVPWLTHQRDALDLARLLLTPTEYEEFQQAVTAPRFEPVNLRHRVGHPS